MGVAENFLMEKECIEVSLLYNTGLLLSEGAEALQSCFQMLSKIILGQRTYLTGMIFGGVGG